MAGIHDIIERAKAQPKHIVLSEGLDPRIVEGAVCAAQAGIAKITLLGPVGEMRELTLKAGDENQDVRLIDPEHSSDLDALVDLYFSRRQHKGINREDARRAAIHPLNFANLMVQAGQADGSVSGAVHTTSDVVRSAIQIIGTAKGFSLVSSLFIILHPQQGAMIYSDCGLVIDPSKDELVEIAAAAAGNARILLGLEPKVAMLSFATGSSAQHALVDKVDQATVALKKENPKLHVDGPIQFDAAIVPDVARRKAPNSALSGAANVFIFPDLNAGNIAYKISERLGGAKAIGPILQGLAKPANDLSRGCDVEAVYNMIAVTAVQAARP